MPTRVADTIKPMGSASFAVVEATDVSGLATVATSGSYNDLTNKPTGATQDINGRAFATQIGSVTNQLSNPTYMDSCLVSDMYANQLAFLPVAQATYEKSSDEGTTWTTISLDNWRHQTMWGGDDKNSLLIDKPQWLRITLTPGSMYVFLDTFIIYGTGNGNKFDVLLEAHLAKDGSTDTWSTLASKTNSGFGAPSYFTIKHAVQYFKTDSGSSSNKTDKIRLTLKCIDNGTTGQWYVSKFYYFGTYPAKSPTIYTTNAWKQVNFPSTIKSNGTAVSLTGHTHTASDITSGLATVATSGSYSDLSNKPSAGSDNLPVYFDNGTVIPISSLEITGEVDDGPTAYIADFSVTFSSTGFHVSGYQYQSGCDILATFSCASQGSGTIMVYYRQENTAWEVLYGTGIFSSATISGTIDAFDLVFTNTTLQTTSDLSDESNVHSYYYVSHTATVAPGGLYRDSTSVSYEGHTHAYSTITNKPASIGSASQPVYIDSASTFTPVTSLAIGSAQILPAESGTATYTNNLYDATWATYKSAYECGYSPVLVDAEEWSESYPCTVTVAGVTYYVDVANFASGDIQTYLPNAESYTRIVCGVYSDSAKTQLVSGICANKKSSSNRDFFLWFDSVLYPASSGYRPDVILSTDAITTQADVASEPDRIVAPKISTSGSSYSIDIVDNVITFNNNYYPVSITGTNSALSIATTNNCYVSIANATDSSKTISFSSSSGQITAQKYTAKDTSSTTTITLDGTTGDLKGTTLTLGSTTLNESQLQQLLALLSS